MENEQNKPMQTLGPGKTEQEKPMQTPAPYAAGTGSVPVALDRDAFARMGYRERLALKKENPEVYKELRK